MINDFRLYLARLLCPETHRIIEIDHEVTDRSIIVFDLINGGDALAKGWGCDPAILFNAARHIQKGDPQCHHNAYVRSALQPTQPDPLADPRVTALRDALRVERDYWVKRADADLADQDANERFMDYPTPRKMTAAMRKADALNAALAAFNTGEKTDE